MGHGATGRGVAGDQGDEAERDGRMGTAMQGGNGAASIGAYRQDERIGSLGEQHVPE
jgi:hypothetical protein